MEGSRAGTCPYHICFYTISCEAMEYTILVHISRCLREWDERQTAACSLFPLLHDPPILRVSAPSHMTHAQTIGSVDVGGGG